MHILPHAHLRAEERLQEGKLPSHDAEVPIDDCLPVYGCPVPSRISVKTLAVQFFSRFEFFINLQVLNCLYFIEFFQEVVGVVQLCIMIRKLEQLPRIPPSRFHDVEPVLCSYTRIPASVLTSRISVDSEAFRRSMAVSADYYPQDPPERMTTALRRCPVSTVH